MVESAGGSPDKRDPYQRLRAGLSDWFERTGGLADRYGEFAMLPLDVVHLTLRLSADPRVSLGEKATMAGTAAYLVSPVDLLPESILGPIGLVDDAALALFVVKRLLMNTDLEILREHWAGKPHMLMMARSLLRVVDDLSGEGSGKLDFLGSLLGSAPASD